MRNFTKGPWLILQRPGEVFNTNIESESGKAIAKCYVNVEHGLAEGIRETMANARLIAAAPELIELMSEVADLLAHVAMSGDAYSRGKAKATVLRIAELKVKVTGDE